MLCDKYLGECHLSLKSSYFKSLILLFFLVCRIIKKRVQDTATSARKDNSCVKGDACHNRLIATTDPKYRLALTQQSLPLDHVTVRVSWGNSLSRIPSDARLGRQISGEVPLAQSAQVPWFDDQQTLTKAKKFKV